MNLNDLLENGYEKVLGMSDPEDPEQKIEDESILLPNGQRACVNWELSGNGYSELDLGDTSYKILSDEELLASAKNEANYWNKSKGI